MIKNFNKKFEKIKIAYKNYNDAIQENKYNETYLITLKTNLDNLIKDIENDILNITQIDRKKAFSFTTFFNKKDKFKIISDKYFELFKEIQVFKDNNNFTFQDYLNIQLTSYQEYLNNSLRYMKYEWKKRYLLKKSEQKQKEIIIEYLKELKFNNLKIEQSFKLGRKQYPINLIEEKKLLDKKLFTYKEQDYILNKLKNDKLFYIVVEEKIKENKALRYLYNEFKLIIN